MYIVAFHGRAVRASVVLSASAAFWEERQKVNFRVKGDTNYQANNREKF